MLVLSRKFRESFQIGLIKVQVLAIHAGRVKLGIEAPEDMQIRRVGSDDEGPEEQIKAGRLGP